MRAARRRRRKRRRGGLGGRGRRRKKRGGRRKRGKEERGVEERAEEGKGGSYFAHKVKDVRNSNSALGSQENREVWTQGSLYNSKCSKKM